mgnify:FL=1
MDAGMKLYRPDGSLVSVKGTKRGAIANFKHLPDYANLVLAGKVWKAQDTTTTAVLVAIPTTVSGLTVQNPASSGKLYVVYALSAYVDVVGAGLATVSSFHCVHNLPIAALTRDFGTGATGAGSAHSLLAGGGGYHGSIILDRGATVVDDGWTPTPLQIVSNIATTNFISMEAPLVTPVIIPPGGHYSIAGVATVVTYEAGWGLTWAELDFDDLD